MRLREEGMILAHVATLMLYANCSPLCWGSGVAASSAIQAQEAYRAGPLRIAVIGFTRPVKTGETTEAPTLEASFEDALARDDRIQLVDRAMFQAAVAGVGYDASINMSTDQARRLGSAIGCDLFVIGKAETVRRSEREGESHSEATIGVMIVDGRTGRLAHFDFILERAATSKAAVDAAARTLGGRARGYVGRLQELREARETSLSRATRLRPASPDDRIEELPDENSPAAIGFKPPEFLNRVKPEYTEQADRADITATVEALAVFRADGMVGEIEIVRWAGFGLDESAARAIRQLKFKPATRDGRTISTRALIRYNFRRVSEADIKPAAQPKSEEKPARDLRELFKPRYRPPY